MNVHHECIKACNLHSNKKSKTKPNTTIILSRAELQINVFCAFFKTCPAMTHLCEKIISTLPSWRKMNGPNQLMSLQQFVYDVQEQLNPLASEDDLRHIAQQLHSIGEVSASI